MFNPLSTEIQTGPNLSVLSALQELFRNEGIENSFTGNTGNTFNSHRLIALAGRQSPECQDRMVETLFKSYFCEVRRHPQLPITQCSVSAC